MAVFAVRTARGAGWDHARGIREQAHWDEHGAFMDGLVEKGVVILGGPVGSDDPGDIALMVVEADDEDAVRAAFARDPWLVHGIFRLSDIRPWTIWLDGRPRAGSPGGSGRREGSPVPDLKQELHHKLRASRAALLSRLDGLSEYDRRRPMTPTGTNLLGLVKHLAGLEYGYLGEALGYPAPEAMSWIEDGSIWQGADMWARPEESSEYIIGLYQRACAHADRVIAGLALDAPGSVAHWPAGRRETTLGVLLIRMVAETAQHAGHADIIRELIDGKGPDQDAIDESGWQGYLARVQAAADAFAPS